MKEVFGRSKGEFAVHVYVDDNGKFDNGIEVVIGYESATFTISEIDRLVDILIAAKKFAQRLPK